MLSEAVSSQAQFPAREPKRKQTGSIEMTKKKEGTENKRVDEGAHMERDRE